MERKTLLLVISGILFALIYIGFSVVIQDTYYSWLLTRLFGLIAFAFLFMSITLGELRLLTKVKAKFKLFKFHTPFAIFATSMVVLHMVSAIFDNYKWGVQLSFYQYLGFSFGDKWLVLLSLGTLALYLMLLVGFTSAKKSIQFITYRRWKLVHYFSYLSFFIAYVHSVNLGTDIKESVFSPFLQPLFILSLLVVVGLLVTRVLKGLNMFTDQSEIRLAATFFLLLVIGSVVLVGMFQSVNSRAQTLQKQIKTDRLVVAEYQVQINRYQAENDRLNEQIVDVRQRINETETQMEALIND